MASQLQYEEMFNDPARRPAANGPNRGYNNMGGMRAASTNFDGYPQPQAGYLQEEFAPVRYENPLRPDRLPAQNMYQTQPFNAYEGAQTWNNNANAFNSATMGAPPRNRTQARRGVLPTVSPAKAKDSRPVLTAKTWIDQPQQAAAYANLQAPQPLHTLPNGHSASLYQQAQQPQRQERQGSTDDNNEELIPTAIVIKNIPFAIKREQLTDVMSEMHLPLPYAFNYHFDNGVFRGLAFANFSSPEETAHVIETMNHMELQGRKLRVEYKKMLPLQERERIEREKRERRGQLEEQHRPMQSMGLHNQPSMSSMTSGHPATSPSPVSMREQTKIDMNDPKTLDYYGKLVVFKDDENRRVYPIEPPVSDTYRRIIHELAHKLGLEHESVGRGETRHVQVYKDKRTNVGLSSSLYYNDTQRRGLARAATMDFNESRDPLYHTLRTQHSALLDVPSSPSGLGGGMGQRSLREAKSFGDLQARTASPALSSSSFPANLTENVRQYSTYGTLQTQSSNNNLRDDYLANNFSNMSLGSGYERTTASARLNGRVNGDIHANAGAIGSQRSQQNLNGLGSLNAYDEPPRTNGTSAVERQPRGPGAEWGSGFARPRQNGHSGRGGSGDLDLGELEPANEQQQQQRQNSRYM